MEEVTMVTISGIFSTIFVIITLAVMLYNLYKGFTHSDESKALIIDRVTTIILLCGLTSFTYLLSGKFLIGGIWVFNAVMWYFINKNNIKLKADEDYDDQLIKELEAELESKKGNK